MTGKRGYIGKVMMPIDFMSKKEKRAYTKKGVVKVSNIYADIKKLPKFKEIREMHKDEAKKLITTLRGIHKSTALQKQWNISSATMYGFFGEIGVETRKRSGGRKNVKGESKDMKNVEKITPASFKEHKEENTKSEALEVVQAERVFIPSSFPKQSGFSISLNGNYSKEELEKRVSGLMGAMFGNKYVVNISIEEIEE